MPQEFHRSKSELKQLLRTLNKGWKALRPEDLAPRMPHVHSRTLASYVTGELDEEAQRTINAHIAFCDSCFEDYVALAGPEKIAEILFKEEITPKETTVVQGELQSDLNLEEILNGLEQAKASCTLIVHSPRTVAVYFLEISKGALERENSYVIAGIGGPAARYELTESALGDAKTWAKGTFEIR